MNPFQQMQILEMSSIECPVCYATSIIYVRSEKELLDSYCLECKTSVHSILNYDIQEQHIEWLKEQWI